MQIYLVFLRRVSRNLRTLLAFTMLVAATMLSTPMRAQTLRDYEFSTGVDASKWKTATNWTTIFTSSDNGNLASGVLNIGFPFPFGSGTYTQFSVNTKGNFRLGPEATANWKQAGLFTSAYYTRNYPKISGVVSDDGFNLGNNGYIRYALTGTAPTRVFVCEYRVNNNNVVGSEANMMWQVQLYEATGEVAIVYGSTDLSAPAYCPHNYQTGLATSPTDIVVLPPNTHMPVYSTTYNETLYYTWHGTNRYYSFMLPSSTCPRPESIAISDIGPTSLTATWVDNSGSTQWEVRLDRRNVQGTPVVVNTPTYTFTNLTNGTDYTVRVRGICGPGDTTAVRSLPVQTLCGYLPLPYSEGFEDALATSSNVSGNGQQNNLPNCWDYHNEGSDYSFYPCVKVGSGLNFAHSGTNYMRSYVNTSSSYKPQYAFLPLTDPIQHPVNSLELRYWIRCQNSSPSHPGTCIVGITPDPTDISTFIPVNTVTYNSITWSERTVQFNNYTGPHGRVTILFPKQTGHPNWTFIDDIYLFFHNSFDTVTHTACNSYTWPENGTTYTNSGTYNTTLPNAAGYDSIITLQLTIYHSYAGDTTAVVCDSITWRGNYYSESGNYIDTISLSPLVGCDSTATLHLTVNHRSGLPAILPGATESHFSVNSTQTVQFSKGNLQYQASTGLWRFAEHQYDYIGDDNHNISSTYNGWIDLFGWGTSGWNSGATAYQPYSSLAGNNNYHPGGSANNDLTGDYVEADWGWHNAIQNGGNRNHLWRTLIHTEWEYLFNTRTTNTNLGTPNARYAKASVNGTHGVILFPDEYTHPADVTVPVGINATDNTGWDGNSYSTTDWSKMDSAGAVFLPVAGSRSGVTYFNSGPTSFYWAADRYISNNTFVHNIKFNRTSLDPSQHSNRYFGYSVRPVHNTEPIIPNDTVAEACDSFNWWNTNYTNNTNTPTHLYTTSAGCDSLVTLHLTINHSSTGDTTATACDSFTWWGTTYTSSTNTATHTFTNAAGCDSVVTLHLTIKNSTTGDTTVTTCNSFTWWNTNYTNSTNTATHTFTNAAGCDSVVTLHLTINHSNTGDTTATACNSFTWWGNSYTSSTNSATHSFTNAAGCDSVVTLHLTINHSNTGDTNATACDSFTWWNTNYTNSTNSATHSFTNAAGCDSVVTLHLTINHSNTGDTNATACNSFNWWGNSYTSSTNSATHTFTNVAGCDSVVTLHLTINHSTTGDTTVTACDSFTWWNTNYTNSTNSATHTFTNAAGCDSVVTLHLTINHSNTGDTTATACDSFTWHGTNYTNSTQNSTFTIQNSVGCDSVVTLHLTINHPTTGDTTVTACNSFTWWGTPYSTTGDYVRTWPSAFPGGCDSVVTLHLTVIYSSTGIEDTTVCNSIVWHGTEYTASTNTPTFTCLNAAGCDSVTTLHLTVNHCSTTPITVCDSYTWRGHTYTATGIYIDGTDTLNLTVNHSNTGDTTVTACDSFTWHGTNYTNSTQNSTFTIQNSVGCDSVVTLHLTINHPTTGDTTVTACNSFTWWGTPYSTTGDYVRTWPSALPGGCDSVVTLHLTVNYSSTGIEDTTVCNSIVWHGTEYTASTNTPTFTCLNAAGCDSVTTLHLTVNHCSTTPITVCDSYTWRGHTYTATGIYIDGTDTLNLTVNHSNTGDTTATACDSFTWHGTNYTNSTQNSTFTIQNSVGCDSVVTLHLTINHPTTGDTTVTACNSFTWWGTNYTTTGDFMRTWPSTFPGGCDSAVTLHLTVNYSTTGDTMVMACDSFTWWGTNYTSSTNTATQTFTNLAGCDFVVTLHLTINHSYTGIEDTTVCNSFIWHGTEYTSSTSTPTFTCLNAAGCDSVTTLHLTVDQCSSTTVTACDSYTWRGNTYTATGIYTVGTDTLNLIVNHSNTGDTTVTACDSFTWWGTNYTSTGDFMRTWPSAFPGGCDSVVTLHLTINHTTTGDTTATACESFIWWGTNYTSTGDFMRTWPSAFPGGCDSTVTLHLTVNPTAVMNHTPDTTILIGENVILHVNHIDNVTWYDVDGNILSISDSLVVSPTTSTTYYISGFNQDTSIALNGDFEAGNVYFTSGYTYTSNLVPEGKYYVGPNAHNYHTGFPNWPDHTTGNGNYMIINGTTSNGITVWSQTVPVIPHTDYDFSAWVCNVSLGNPDNVAYLQFSINGVQLGNVFHCPTSLYTWEQFYEVWNSGENTSATISILNLNTTSAGNDFGIDDIRFSALTSCIGYDSIHVNVQSPSHTYIDICDNQLPYAWNGSTFTSGGVYDVSIPRPGNSDSIATLHLTVNPMTVLTHTPDTVIMAGDTITLWATGATWLTWTDSNGAQLSNTGYLSVHPTVTTSYYVSSFSEGPNLVYNGDFELGNTGFTNDYIYGNTGSYGHYHVGYDIAEMWPWDSPGFAVHDHTSNSGLFLMIDGAIQPMTRVWSQTVEVTPHTEYLFSSWILTDNAGYFKYEINGVQTGFDYVTPDTQWEWKRYSQVWNSDTCTHATLSIVNRFSQSAGYDYCIDDITFSPLTSCSVTDTVTVNIYTYTYYDSSICADMLPFVWHNNNLYSSGIYTDTINAGGNDIIVTLTLSVNPVYNDTINDTICSNGSSLFEGVSYTTAGLHTVPLHTTAGCDSIRSLNLTVNAAHSADTTAMVCDSIIWNGVWRTANGDYSYTTTTATGCDSTATLHLTVNHSTIGDTTASACDSFTWHGTNYTNSTQNSTFTIQNSVGCDSVVTLHLTINHATTGDTTVTACDSFTWHGTNYTNSTQNSTFTIQNSVGCDSVVTLHLTVNYSNTGIEDTTVCNSFVWHGTTYTESTQNSTFTIQNSVGCDSTITLHLTVNQCSSTSVTACDSYTWHGSIYTETGIYTDGADTLHLTINLSTTGDTTATACGSFTWHGTTYTESTQNPTFTSQNSNGCDSTVTLRLTIYNSTSATDSVTSCHPLQWVDGNTYTASTDSPVFTLQSVHGCDSVVTLHFELLPTSYTDIADSFCTGTPYLFGTLILTEGGLYTDTLTAANSCDSIVSLNLTKLLLPHINIVQTDDCLTQSHYIHVETDVDYLYWTCDASSWNNGWGSVHSRNLTVNNHYPVTLTLMADYYEYPTCPNTAIVTLQPLVQPHALMTVSPEFITYETPTLVALSQSTGAQRLQWYIDGDDAGNSQSITYTPPSGYDSVVVTLIAFSDFCSDTTERTIPIKQQALYLPNAFTPNESTNNTFSVFYDGIVEYELYIYNRQGTLLFHSNTNGEAWDGRYNGIPCPEGSYVWLVKYRSEVDPQNWHYAKGTVTLIY